MDSPPMPLRFVKSAGCRMRVEIGHQDDETRATIWIGTGFGRTGGFCGVRQSERGRIGVNLPPP